MKDGSIPKKSIQDEKFLNALADAFRLQEAIINATDLAIIATSPEGLISSFNKGAEKLLGYSSEEVIGKANPLMFHDMAQVIDAAEQLSSELGINAEPVFDVFTKKVDLQDQPYRREWKLIRKDHSTFSANLAMSGLRDDVGQLIGYIIVVQDISEQKRISEEARAIERKFQILAENVPGVIYLCRNDAKYTMVYVNEKVKDLCGYSADEFLDGAITVDSLIHGEDKDLVREAINLAIAEKKGFHIRYRLRHKRGEYRWVEEFGTPVFEGNSFHMLEGFVSDITGHVDAERKLIRAAEENLRVFNNPVTLNAIAGFDGYFKRVSASWEKTLGWTTEELLETPFIEFVHPDDREETMKAAEYIAAGNNLVTFENRYRSKDGSYKWLLWGSASDVGDRVIYASAIDITTRKRSEEDLLDSKKNLEAVALKLQEQNRQLDEFAHIISHNLRSPIGNIQALINLLDENSSIGDYKLIFDKLKNVAKNLGETMNDLMDTMKARASESVEKSEIRFKEILDKVVQSLEGDLILTEASVTFDFNQASSIVYPRPYLESIFQNLLTNALKYRARERKPMIHFSTAIVKNSIELRVSDNGQGIDMGRFGDKLFGLHKTFHSHEQARGVGLFLIKTQIESLGGSIRAESTVGKGTTFIIRLS